MLFNFILIFNNVHSFCVGDTHGFQHDFNLIRNFLVFYYCLFTGYKSKWNSEHSWYCSSYYFHSVDYPIQFEFDWSLNRSNQRKVSVANIKKWHTFPIGFALHILFFFFFFCIKNGIVLLICFSTADSEVIFVYASFCVFTCTK